MFSSIPMVMHDMGSNFMMWAASIVGVLSMIAALFIARGAWRVRFAYGFFTSVLFFLAGDTAYAQGAVGPGDFYKLSTLLTAMGVVGIGSFLGYGRSRVPGAPKMTEPERVWLAIVSGFGGLCAFWLSLELFKASDRLAAVFSMVVSFAGGELFMIWLYGRFKKTIGDVDLMTGLPKPKEE